MSFDSSMSICLLVITVWVLCATVWMVTSTTNSENFNCFSRRTSNSSTTHDVNPATVSLATLLKQYSSKILGMSSHTEEKCTMVMLAVYRQTTSVPRLLLHYCKSLLLQKIIVIWNASVPITADLSKQCVAELKLVLLNGSKLMSKYLPRKEIETDCKCHTTIVYFNA